MDMYTATPTFAIELEKIAMARVFRRHPGHLATRLIQHTGAAKNPSMAFENAVFDALKKAGGPTKRLGTTDFHIPIRRGETVIGNLTLENAGRAGHAMGTFRPSSMGLRRDYSGQASQDISQSFLSGTEKKSIKSAIRKWKKDLW
jgi:hypothetical protein